MVEAPRADALASALRSALDGAGCAHADLYAKTARRGFARFSRGLLDQHAELLETHAVARVAVPVVDGFRVGRASTSDVRPEGLRSALARAAFLAERAPPLVGWPGIRAADGTVTAPPRWAEATAGCGPDERATRLAPALAHAAGLGLRAAGTLEARAYEVALASTAGVERAAAGTIAEFRIFAHDAEGASGFAQAMHRDVGALDIAGCAREACATCVGGRDPIKLPAGDYDVVLEPPAVADLLQWLSYVAFGAAEVESGSSPLAGRAGEAITGEAITVVDDPADASELGFGVPFDREGVASRRVVLIDRGRAGTPVYDRFYAARAGTASTGHATVEGPPRALCVALTGGTHSRDELLAGIERGLHVPRLHYVNGLLEPRRAVMTGLTRDGLFLVEGGVRTRGVRNMRFTDSVLEALARADALGAARQAVLATWAESGAFVAPAVRIRGLRFTSGGVDPPGV